MHPLIFTRENGSCFFREENGNFIMGIPRGGVSAKADKPFAGAEDTGSAAGAPCVGWVYRGAERLVSSLHRAQQACCECQARQDCLPLMFTAGWGPWAERRSSLYY